MISPFLTKAIFLHQRTSLPRNGDDLVELLKDGGFKTVYIKGADGVYPYKVYNWSKLTWEENITQDLVNSCHAANINVVGYGFNYGVDAAGEGRIGANQVNRFGLDGWIFDIEETFDLRVGAVEKVKLLINTFKSKSTSPTGYCSWPRFLNMHPLDVAIAGMKLCDVGIPMVYWYTKNLGLMVTLANALTKSSIEEWMSFTNKPIIPTGRAFQENGYTSSVDSILAFDQCVKDAELGGESWWFLDHAQPSKKIDWWNAIRSSGSWCGSNTAPPTFPPPSTDPVYTDYVVIHKKINIRSGASVDSSWVRYAVENEVLHLLDGINNGYAKLTDGNYVWFEFLKKVLPDTQAPIPQPVYSEYIVIRPLINVRSKPSSDSMWMGYVAAGDRLKIVGSVENGYAKMINGNYVWYNYLKEA